MKGIKSFSNHLERPCAFALQSPPTKIWLASSEFHVVWENREKEIKGERERNKASQKCITNKNHLKASPNVSMIQKTMICRDTAYLKIEQLFLKNLK